MYTTGPGEGGGGCATGHSSCSSPLFWASGGVLPFQRSGDAEALVGPGPRSTLARAS